MLVKNKKQITNELYYELFNEIKELIGKNQPIIHINEENNQLLTVSEINDFHIDKIIKYFDNSEIVKINERTITINRENKYFKS